jgi:ABC-type uncharacterized transport system substrate-binding protein
VTLGNMPEQGAQCRRIIWMVASTARQLLSLQNRQGLLEHIANVSAAATGRAWCTGGNATGVNPIVTSLDDKRLALLKELAPNAKHIAVLMNPCYPPISR